MLTAAIVGIAIAVIGLISGGVEDASEGINGELETAGGFSNAFDGPPETSFGWTADQYSEAFPDGDANTLSAAMEADAPEGHYFSGWIDGSSGKPLYTADDQQSFNVDRTTYSFDGYWAQANGSYPLS